MSKPLVWLVTGASSGLGRELALTLLERGDKVIATARSKSLAKLADLKTKGADTLELDVTAPLDQLHTTAKKAIAIHGRIDVLVNNAGYVAFGALEENTPDETFDQFNTHVFGALNLTRALLPYMRARKSGTIVWVVGAGGHISGPGAGVCGSSKHALRGISAALHQEIAPLGLRSIIMSPGLFRTRILDEGSLAPFDPRISDYESMTRATHEGMSALSGIQPGDPKKCANVVIDVVKGEGVAKDKPFVSELLLGADCYNLVRGSLVGMIESIDAWKEVTCSTDYDK